VKVYGPVNNYEKQTLHHTDDEHTFQKSYNRIPQELSITTRLSSLFVENGIEVPFAQIQTLERELSSLGITPLDLDFDSAFRALLLHRHSLPLSLSLIKNVWSQEDVILAQLNSLRADARSLLADKRLSKVHRIVIESFLKDINTIVSKNTAQLTLWLALDSVVETWAYAFEAKIVLLDECSLDVMEQLLKSPFHSYHVVLDTMNSGECNVRRNPQTERLIESLRTVISELRLSIQNVQVESVETLVQIRESLSILIERVLLLTGEFEAVINAHAPGQIPGSIIIGFLQENIRGLKEKLHTVCNDYENSHFVKKNVAYSLNVWSLRSFLQKSGMEFERRLFLWYLSGMNSRSLHNLVHSDLKGILFHFRNQLQHHNSSGRLGYKVGHLQNRTHTILGYITKCQLENILYNHQEKVGLFLEFPFGDTDELSYALVRARGRKKDEYPAFDLENLSLSLIAETSRLGTVGTFIVFSGKTVSLTFEFRTKEIVAVAEKESYKIRESLNAWGMRIKSISYGITSTDGSQIIHSNSRDDRVNIIQ
jgi:hypothetical protein